MLMKNKWLNLFNPCLLTNWFIFSLYRQQINTELEYADALNSETLVESVSNYNTM